MRRHVLATVLAAATVVTQAPAAQADHEATRCRYVVTKYDAVTGADTWHGVVLGAATGAPDETVRVECVVTVDGVAVASSGVGEGVGAAAVASPLTFRQADDQYGELCTRTYTTSHGWREACGDQDPRWIAELVWYLKELRYEVYATVNALFVEHVDPAVCSVLTGQAGAYGPVTIDPDGDVHVTGELVWDCAPYEG